MKQKILISTMFVGVIFLTGCSSEMNTVVDIIKIDAIKKIADLEVKQAENRDWKRTRDLDILLKIMQIYASDNNKIYANKDDKGTYKLLKLIKGSPDYNTFKDVVNKVGLHELSSDPSDPERYYEYFSDEKTFSIKADLEIANSNCKVISPGHCEYEVKSDLQTSLELMQQ